MTLENKVAIVTGAARGIGFACASRFAQEGAKVVLADIDETKGEASAQSLRDAGLDVTFTVCDVSERLDVRNLVTETVAAYGAVDVLVNNAGIIIGSEFLDLTEEDFDKVLAVNLKGAFLVGQAVARQMVKQIDNNRAPGSIINMSSINAVLAIPNQVPYTISKGGLNQLTKVMALALADKGIRVNAIGPGSIMTDILNSVADDDAALDRILSRTPMGRIGDPEEIAGVAVFLASDDSSYVTGQTIYADGGRLPQNYPVTVKS